MSKALSLAATLLLTVAGTLPALAAPLTLSSEKTVLFVTETVSAGGAVNVFAKSGPLTTSEQGFGINRLVSTAKDGTVPAALPAITFAGAYGTPTGLPDSGTVLDVANARIKGAFPTMQSALGVYLKKYGINSSWFNFKQEVQLDANGVAETWTIYWDFFTDQNGRGAFGDAKLVPPNPKVLYVTYTPLQVDKDLPSTWAYADAGVVKYQLRNMEFQPLTAWATVDVGGAYDVPQTDTQNANTGVACLMDATNPGCTFAAVDVKRLLDSTGATLAVVDYTRRVEPVWVTQPDGTQVPQMSTKIDTRDVSYTGCTDTSFRNTGTFGYTLSTRMGRYMANSTGSPRVVNFQQLNEYSGTSLSPTQSYDYSLKVNRSDVNSLGSYGIDPVKGGALLAITDIPGLISVAPINVLNTPVSLVGSATGAIWQYGGKDDAYQVTWTLKCSMAHAGYDIDTKIEATRHWDGWHPSVVLTSAVSDTGWSSVALSQFSDSRYLAYADYASGIVHLAEGSTSGAYAYRASGGGEGYSNDFVYAHNNFSMEAPGNYNYSYTNNNVTTYDCGAASKPADVYVDGVFQYRADRMTCTGSTFLRGFYMDSGAPYWQNVAISQTDPTINAVWVCDDAGVCGYRIDKTSPACRKGLCDIPP